MNIEFEELTHENLPIAIQIDRADIPEDFVDYADTIMEITDYGKEHHCPGHTWLIKADNHYAGLILLGDAIPWETDPVEMQREPFYRLMGFVIDRSCRSKGLGGMILEKAIDQIYKEFGKRPIALGCHKDNIRAAKFYQNHGFKSTGVYEGNDEYYLRLLHRVSD